ncbi:MAG: DUF2946 family protein [Bacteroidota bacterium]
MSNRTKTFVSVLLLIVYGTLTFVSVPYHVHDDSSLATGSGQHEFAQHDDAHQCKHHSIELHDDCVICNSVFHSTAVAVGTIVPMASPTTLIYSPAFSSVSTSNVHSSHSHRGPPIILG